jgi:hypothetical protein
MISTTWSLRCTRVRKHGVISPLRDPHSNQPRPWRWVHFITQPVKKVSNKTTIFIIVFTEARYCGLPSATYAVIFPLCHTRISRIFRQASGVRSSHKKYLINIFPQTLIFRGMATLRPLDLFYGDTRSNSTWRDTSSTHFYVSRTIHKRPETFEMLWQSMNRRVQCVHWFR